MTAATLYHNATFHTVDPALPRAAAMLVSDGRIRAIGDVQDVRRQAGAAVEEVDLGGAFVMPAFIDSHLHFAWGSRYLSEVRLREARTFADVLQRLKDYAAANPHLPWIIGNEFSYGYPDLPEGAFHRSMLDAIVPDRPVFFKSGMAHAAWVNSRLLEIAGITRQTPDPAGGEIVRDASGEPTGWLKEKAWSDIEALAPKPSAGDLRAMLAAGIREANRLGIARVQSAGFDDDAVPLLAELQNSGQLTLRFTLSSVVNPDSDPAETIARVAAWRSAHDPDWLDARVIKFFLDGVLESHTGSMPQGYADKPEERGILLWNVPAYRNAVAEAQAAGFQVWTHAIGTGAIEMALDAYEADAARSRRLRPRAEHVEIPTARDIARFAEIGAIASLQPAMIYPRDQWLGMEGLWEIRAGREALARAFPLRSILDHGGRIAFGTDWPIVDLNPLIGIRNAVLRRSLDGQPPGGWVPEQAVTLAEAIKAYTLDAAYAAHRETEEGSLTAGKLADFITLDGDPFAIPADDVARLSVTRTFVGGARVWVA